MYINTFVAYSIYTALDIAACGSFCNKCDINGGSKCDAGHCSAGAVYVESSQSCICKSCHYTCMLPMED